MCVVKRQEQCVRQLICLHLTCHSFHSTTALLLPCFCSTFYRILDELKAECQELMTKVCFCHVFSAAFLSESHHVLIHKLFPLLIHVM